ncbi:MAG TPA: hypothetical protein VN203_05095 [Candidatus Acidoferrum sp.]|nr:hypothetical protein [Candidatus Acidoferrum sp.]
MDNLSLEIDPQDVLRLQGYRRPSDIPTPDVLALLHDAMAEARRVLEPLWIFQEFRVESVTPEGCRLVDGPTLLVRNLQERWGTIALLGLAVCTVGEALEERIETLFAKREFPVAYMLDSLGSVAVEALAETVLRRVCAERLKMDLKVTARESPGYARWPIEEQRKVFSLVPAARIGVAINPYCIMTPRKSISFAAGIGPDAKMGDSLSPCQSCDMHHCAYRRAPRRQVSIPAWTLGISPLVLDFGQSLGVPRTP